MRRNLSGRKLVITGAARGIGEKVARLAAARGAHVALIGLEPDRLRALADELGPTASWWEADVRDGIALRSAIDNCAMTMGGIDIIVANAGTGGGQLWPDEPTDVWDGFVKLNLNGMMFLCRAAWPHLVASGAGSAIAITSLSAWMGIGRDQLAKMGGAPSASYQASKAAMEGLVVHLAGRGGEHNVRVNAIRPGRILTDKFRSWLGEDGIFWNHYKEVQLIKRHGSADDIANAALFLASDESSFITGTVLDVNGGAVVKI